MVSLIDVPYWWHSTLFEILWTIGGLVAFGCSVWNLVEAAADVGSLDLIRGRPTIHERHFAMIELVAYKNLRDELIRLALALLVLSTGLVGVLTPNPLGGTTTLTGFAVTVCLVGVSLGLMAWGVADARDRRRLSRMAKKRTLRLPGELPDSRDAP